MMQQDQNSFCLQQGLKACLLYININSSTHIIIAKAKIIPSHINISKNNFIQIKVHVCGLRPGIKRKDIIQSQLGSRNWVLFW
jgi:hypothetical protein